MPRKKAITEGWVYAISDPTRPGLLKIGCTDRAPEIRAAELSGTHAPLPLIVEYQIRVLAALDAERDVHRILDTAGARFGKEWFACGLDVAIDAINEACGPEAVERKRRAHEAALHAAQAKERERVRRVEELLAHRAREDAAIQAARRAYEALPLHRRMVWSVRDKWKSGAVQEFLQHGPLLLAVAVMLGVIVWTKPWVGGILLTLALVLALSQVRRETLEIGWLLFCCVVALLILGVSVWNAIT